MITRPGLAAVSLPPSLRFGIFRKGDRIGTHTVDFQPSGDGMLVTVKIDIAVKLAFITVFSYQQEGRETWRDGRLVASDITTVDSGKKTTLTLRSQGGRLKGSGADGALDLAPEAMTDLGFWTTRIMDPIPVVDSQTGEAGKLKVSGPAKDAVEVKGAQVAAQRWEIAAPSGRSGSAWYDAQGHWIAARFTTRGELLVYQLES